MNKKIKIGLGVAAVVVVGFLLFGNRGQSAQVIKESATAKKGDISRSISKDCGVTFGAQVTIKAESAGKVSKVNALEERTVKKGTEVVVLSNPDIFYTRRAAEATYEKTKLERDRLSGSLRRQADKSLEAAKAQRDQARANEAALKARAPFAGVITKMYVKQNEHVQMQQALYDIVDQNTVQATCTISDREFQDIGTAVKDNYFKANATFNGQDVPVTFNRRSTYTVTSSNTQAYEVYLNGTDKFPAAYRYPGFVVPVTMTIQIEKDVVSVPLRYIATDKDGVYVWVKNAQGQLEKKYIEVGITDGSQIVVTNGINENTEVHLVQ